MGNMIFNRRMEDVLSPATEKPVEHRIFAEHMYTLTGGKNGPVCVPKLAYFFEGPKKLGDPHYRRLSNMEKDPMISSRMRDIARTDLCQDAVKRFTACTQREGFKMVYACTKERDQMAECIENWTNRPEFQERVEEEYLNERSHFRETGIKTRRYKRGAYVLRDLEREGPAMDADGNYRPRKPTGWDESYSETGAPSWSNYKY